MAYKNGITKQSRCRLCPWVLLACDYPEDQCLEHLNISHPDVASAVPDLAELDTQLELLDRFFKFFSTIPIRNVRSS